MRPPIYVVLALVAAVSLLVARPAVASCAGPAPPPGEALARADAVFSGRVISTESNGILGLPSSSDRVYFAVDRSWKGITTPEVVLMSYRSSVDYSFEKGQSYLVYARKGDLQGQGNALNADTCGRTKLLSEAQEDLRQLGPGRPVQGEEAAGTSGNGPVVLLAAITTASALGAALLVRRRARPLSRGR